MHVLCEVILGEQTLIAASENYGMLKLLMRKCVAEKYKQYGACRDGTPWTNSYWIQQVPLAPFLSEGEVSQLEHEAGAIR